MRILGIESSCDETAAAVVDEQGVVHSNIISSQIPVHARYGGVIPELASRNHLMAIQPVVAQALADANCTLGQLDRIAVTLGPGLVGALMVGVQFAKSLAVANNIPLIPIHHVEGHITAVTLKDAGEHPHGPLQYPYVALAVSGGHTSLYIVRKPGSYEVIGYTLDDAAGEAFDKVARLLGLPYPGGVEIDRLAGSGNPQALSLPRPLKGKEDLNFSFSGLKTAVRLAVEQHKPDDTTTPISLADVAASFQEAVVDVLLRKTYTAAKLHNIEDVVISGGVAANSRLRKKLTDTAADHGLRGHLTRPIFCTDNAAMIAGAARFKEPNNQRNPGALEPFASGQLAPEL